MKPTPTERIAALERQATARHLATEPGPDELAFIAEQRRLTETGEWFEPRQWTDWDGQESRVLWAEIQLGLSARWPDPPPELFKNRAAYERFLDLAAKEQ